MKRSLTEQSVSLVAVILLTVSTLIGCSSGENLQTQFTGSWQRSQGEGTVEIDLANDPKSLKIDGKTYPATIEKVNKGQYSIHLKVETTPGNTEAWILRQVWDDNGSSFKIAFRHNGTQETLEAGSSI
jgi:hypothetical protein